MIYAQGELCLQSFVHNMGSFHMWIPWKVLFLYSRYWLTILQFNCCRYRVRKLCSAMQIL